MRRRTLVAKCRDCDFVVTATDETIRFHRGRAARHVEEQSKHTVDLEITTHEVVARGNANAISADVPPADPNGPTEG